MGPKPIVSREALVCELAAIDERGVGIEWVLQERSDGSAPTVQELSQGGTRARPALQTAAVVGDTAVRVYAATVPSTSAPVPRQRLTEEGLATLAALVAALRSR